MVRAERMGLEPIEHPFQNLGRNARPVVGDRERQGIVAPLRRQRDGAAGGREAHSVGQQVKENLPHATLVGDEAADVVCGADVEHETGADQPVLNPFGGRRHGGTDVDRSEIELHAAGVDGRQIEDVVDQRQQRVGGDRDVVEIFALLRRQRPGTRVAEQMDEADDVGERRAQLVGHVVNEIDLDLVGVLERLVALAQRTLDVDRVGDIVERHQCGAVRQRHGPAIDHAAVAPFQPSRYRLAAVDRRDDLAQRLPDGVVAMQRPA